MLSKTFILGVGAQKAGTTWLYRYLSKQPSFNMGHLKEYHIWDCLNHESPRNRCPRSLLDAFEFKSLIPSFDYGIFLRHLMQKKDGFYEYYFRRLTRHQAHSTGDITPGYAGLSKEVFREVKERLILAGFDVKVVFLLRDPLERCWSAVRMSKRKGRIVGTDSELLRARYKSPNFFLRTDYKSTIETLEQVFDKRNLYFGIYEEMFTLDQIEKLSAFCGFQPDFTFTSERFEVSQKVDSLDQAVKKEVMDFYSEIYDFCYGRFPQTRWLWSQREQCLTI